MNPKGGFQKGQVANPNGRPKRPEIEELRLALKKAKENNDKSFIEHYVELAFKDKQVAIALANKVLPELKEIDLGENTQAVLRVLFGVDKDEPNKVSKDTERK
jgi:hypothetical protein